MVKRFLFATGIILQPRAEAQDALVPPPPPVTVAESQRLTAPIHSQRTYEACDPYRDEITMAQTAPESRDTLLTRGFRLSLFYRGAVVEAGLVGEEKAVDVPECRKNDEMIDELARRAAETLRGACYPERGGDGNEWGVAIYHDQNDALNVTELYTSGSTLSLDPSLGVAASGGDIRRLVAIMHCHPDGNADHSNIMLP